MRGSLGLPSLEGSTGRQRLRDPDYLSFMKAPHESLRMRVSLAVAVNIRRRLRLRLQAKCNGLGASHLPPAQGPESSLPTYRC